MNLGDLGGYHQPRNLKQLVGRYVLVADRLLGIRRVAQPGIGIRSLAGHSSELIDESVVFPGKHVVIETRPDGPVVRKAGSLLPFPFGVDRIIFVEYRQIAVASAA